jgi:hypothetical protein
VRGHSEPGNLVLVTAPARGGDEGDTVRNACFNLYLSWLLVFGGSGSLLRRAA